MYILINAPRQQRHLPGAPACLNNRHALLCARTVSQLVSGRYLQASWPALLEVLHQSVQDCQPMQCSQLQYPPLPRCQAIAEGL